MSGDCRSVEEASAAADQHFGVGPPSHGYFDGEDSNHAGSLIGFMPAALHPWTESDERRVTLLGENATDLLVPMGEFHASLPQQRHAGFQLDSSCSPAGGAPASAAVSAATAMFTQLKDDVQYHRTATLRVLVGVCWAVPWIKANCTEPDGRRITSVTQAFDHLRTAYNINVSPSFVARFNRSHHALATDEDRHFWLQRDAEQSNTGCMSYLQALHQVWPWNNTLAISPAVSALKLQVLHRMMHTKFGNIVAEAGQWFITQRQMTYQLGVQRAMLVTSC